ncbi:MAG: hypothetical protein R3C14_32555 [Caldilineaceae bacterium]
MKQQAKLRFLAFVVAVLLAVGGLAAQSHNVYVGAFFLQEEDLNPRTKSTSFREVR